MKGESAGAADREILRKIPLQGIYASPLERTLETAARWPRQRGCREVEPGWSRSIMAPGRKGFWNLKQLEGWKASSLNGELCFPGWGGAVAGAAAGGGGDREDRSRAGGEETIACFTHGTWSALRWPAIWTWRWKIFTLEVDTGSITQLAFEGRGGWCIQLTWPEG